MSWGGQNAQPFFQARRIVEFRRISDAMARKTKISEEREQALLFEQMGHTSPHNSITCTRGLV